MSLDGTQSRASGFLRAHVWIISFAMAASVFAAIALFALRPTKYVSSSSVLIQPDVSRGAATAPQMGTEAAIASSGDVLQGASDLLHEPESVLRRGLSVSNPVDTTVLAIAFKGATPTAAYNGANAITRAYVDYRNGGGENTRVAEVITPATIPADPSSVNYTLVVTVAAMCGFLQGIAASVVVDLLEKRARGRLSGAQPGKQLVPEPGPTDP